ncbi:hypothetical protein JCM8097_003416 [Rhodosporidiobolus ruineniae]
MTTSSAPWGVPSSSSAPIPPPVSAPLHHLSASDSRPSTPSPAPPAFSSSFGAFGLPQPRSNLAMQLERAHWTTAGGQGGGVHGDTDAQGAFSNPPSVTTTPFGAPLSGSALFGGAGAAGTAAYPFPFVNSTGPRRPSMLAGDATMMYSSDEEDERGGSGTSGGRSGGGSSSVNGTRRRPGGLAGPGGGGGDEMMSLSPAYDTGGLPHPTSAAHAFSTISRRSRSRSASESGGAPIALSTSFSFTPATASSSAANGLFNVPPSPVTVARALQAGQKTPPPFLQRRLFKDERSSSAGSVGGEGMMQEDSASGRSSRSGSSSDVPPRRGSAGAGQAGGKGKDAVRAMTSALLDDDEEIEELSATLSRSASAGAGEEGVVRRPVSRRPNLLPKTKSHLRILSELRTEAAPGDQSEIASEATLHRLSRAGAAVPALRSSCPPSMDTRLAPLSSSSTSAPTSSTAPHPPSHGFPGQSSKPKPPPNRFPESANPEDDDDLLSSARSALSSDSGEDVGAMDETTDNLLEVGSDWGGMSVGGYATEDDDQVERRRSEVVWNGIRSGPGGSAVTVAVPTGVGRSPGAADRRTPGTAGSGMDVEFVTPQTPSSFTARPGKRKINDDRFEPYAHQAFKRRAVSPAASLSLSPGFHASSAPKHPTPPPIPSSSLALSISTSTTHTAPVAIPSPTTGSFSLPPANPPPPTAPPHHQFFTSVSASSGFTTSLPGTRSAAASPSTSLSSSAGTASRGFMSFALSDRHRPISAREEVERQQAMMRVEPEGIGRMSLGGGGGDAEEEELAPHRAPALPPFFISLMSSPSSLASDASATPVYLPAHVPSLRCATCTLDLSLQDELVSRSFQSGSGPAVLVRSACNVDVGKQASKNLISGKHVIAPIYCSGCSTELGWKYFSSPESSQKYKEGKVILERSKIYKDNKWSLDD